MKVLITRNGGQVFDVIDVPSVDPSEIVQKGDDIPCSIKEIISHALADYLKVCTCDGCERMTPEDQHIEAPGKPFSYCPACADKRGIKKEGGQ